jgi:hypothetical protein
MTILTPGCARVGSRHRPLVFETWAGSPTEPVVRMSPTVAAEAVDAIIIAKLAIESGAYRLWGRKGNHLTEEETGT